MATCDWVEIYVRWIRDKVKSKSTNERLTSGKRKDNSLNPCLTNLLGGGEQTERGKKEEEESFRVRSSHLSLDFPAIESSNSSETRGKVDPHCKSYAWVPEVWSSITPRGRGFLLLDLFFG